MSVVPKATRYVATVVSTKMQKSCVVVIEKMKWNTHIKKYIPKRERMIVHDENNIAVLGDKVLIEAVGRKISAHKTFEIKEIVKKASLEKEFYTHLNSPDAVQVAKEVTKSL